MKTTFSLLSLAFVLLVQTACAQEKKGLPKGWFKAGSHPASYKMGVDMEVHKVGKSSAYMSSIEDKIDGFGTLMQTMSSKAYRGQKVKLKGYLKTQNVSDWSGLWFRVDYKKCSVAFDNMQDRAPKGTTDWTLYEIILDVPAQSQTLNFGALQAGTGTTWFDGLELEIVGPADSPKPPIENPRLSKEPQNLDFED